MIKHREFLICLATSMFLLVSPQDVPASQQLIVNVRRDTANGLPYGEAHMVGISSIVWGYSGPGENVQIVLSKAGEVLSTRSTNADHNGYFSVSMDRLIEDGDLLSVTDSSNSRMIIVPTMTYSADPVTNQITGVGPTNITNTSSGAPHTLRVSIGGRSRQVTTAGDGSFVADFSVDPFHPGFVGSMRYITLEGDHVYKPIFINGPPTRGAIDDWWADIILGQLDFSEIGTNEVKPNRVFNPGGVYMDRSVEPNRMYVYDAGNSRVLGLSHLGTCEAGLNSAEVCTNDIDCPNSTCDIDEHREADLIFGQPSSFTSACNGDSNYQSYPDVPMADSETLCGLFEGTVSIGESGSGITMATDNAGNFYLPDYFNNRVLRYNNPFETDTVADYVWGQEDFSGIHCNRGAGIGAPSAGSLCLSAPPGWGTIRAGLAVDTEGNLWIADNINNRVLRFPFDPIEGVPAKVADLVLGQNDFISSQEGTNYNQMDNPNAVRVSDTGTIYVSDESNLRVLVFEPPLSSGMDAADVFGEGDLRPMGLELDPSGDLWVNDEDNMRFVKYVDGNIETEFFINVQGQPGVDNAGNVYGTGYWVTQQVVRHSPPSFDQSAVILQPEGGDGKTVNANGPSGLYSGFGIEIAAGQLINSDGKRIIFWNNPWSVSNFQEADGVIGQPDFYTRTMAGREYGRMRADNRGNLWVIYGGAVEGSLIYAYVLPLTSGAEPIVTLSSPLPLLGGGDFHWSGSLALGGIDYQPDCDCLWLSDRDYHRVFRVKDVNTNPIVDIVLGQTDVNGIDCNQGRDPNEPYQRPQHPTSDSLCYPGALSFDRNGNLYVADHNLELAGNLRLLMYSAQSISISPSSAIFGIPASRVFGRDNDFTAPNCLDDRTDPLCGPFEPAFDSLGHMILGQNGYTAKRFPFVYYDVQNNPLPIAALGDYHSMPTSARFDALDNLYVLDHNRSRILIYLRSDEQPYSVAGAINTSTGHPVSGVEINVAGYASSAVSDELGEYELSGLLPGIYEVTLSKDNYFFTPNPVTLAVPPSVDDQDFIAIPPVFLPLIVKNH